MKNKSVFWLLTAVLLITVLLFAACGGQGTAPTPTPSPTPTPAPEPTGGPPAIPHTLEGRDDCLMCHESGEQAIPVDHAGRTSDTCTTCHTPGA